MLFCHRIKQCYCCLCFLVDFSNDGRCIQAIKLRYINQTNGLICLLREVKTEVTFFSESNWIFSHTRMSIQPKNFSLPSGSHPGKYVSKSTIPTQIRCSHD